MQFDAITAGVRPGGLNNRFQIRLLVCYVAREIGCPISSISLCELMHYKGVANYFEMVEAVYNLKENGYIDMDEETTGRPYTVTAKGLDMLSEFERDLPNTIKEVSVKYVEKMITLERNKKENKVWVESLEGGGCMACCSVMEGEREQLTIRLYTPDEDCARRINDMFLEDPTKVFVRVLDLMTGVE